MLGCLILTTSGLKYSAQEIFWVAILYRRYASILGPIQNLTMYNDQSRNFSGYVNIGFHSSRKRNELIEDEKFVNKNWLI